jgi:hypothetical protein
VTDLDLVMVGEPLSMLRKDGHIADDGVRAIPTTVKNKKRPRSKAGHEATLMLGD